MTAEKRKRRISKCEVCPYFAKNHEKGKWECSLISYGSEKSHKSCIFNSDEWDNDNNKQTEIIERWIRANE